MNVKYFLNVRETYLTWKMTWSLDFSTKFVYYIISSCFPMVWSCVFWFIRSYVCLLRDFYREPPWERIILLLDNFIDLVYTKNTLNLTECLQNKKQKLRDLYRTLRAVKKFSLWTLSCGKMLLVGVQLGIIIQNTVSYSLFNHTRSSHA